MLYFYKYYPDHKIEKLNKFLNHFFETLFKEEHDEFSIDTHVTDEFKEACKNCSALLKSNMIDIFNKYKSLSSKEKEIVKEAHNSNLDIERLCLGSNPFRYGIYVRKPRPKRLERKDFTFFELLKDFMTGLWEGAFSRDGITEICGTVKEHFNDFCSLNKNIFVCPFCGLEKLPNEHTKERPAYDHYLSQGDYPFINVNFRNLVPICDTCNGPNYKHSKDILEGGRKAFYPYSDSYKSIEVSIQGSFMQIENDSTLEINITNEGVHIEEIKTWDDIFQIKDRYKAEIKKRADRLRGHVFTKYRKKKNLEDTKDDIMFEVEYPYDEPGAIIKKLCYEYFFNYPDFETQLSEVVQ